MLLREWLLNGVFFQFMLGAGLIFAVSGGILLKYPIVLPNFKEHPDYLVVLQTFSILRIVFIVSMVYEAYMHFGTKGACSAIAGGILGIGIGLLFHAFVCETIMKTIQHIKNLIDVYLIK